MPIIRPRMTEEEIKKYETEQKQILSNHKIGKEDLNGYRITKIFSRSDDFVIYEIDTNIISESIRVLVYPAEQDDPNNFEENFSKIKVDFNDVKSSLYKARRDNALKHIISSAVAMGIYGQVEDSKTSLAKIKERIDVEYREHFFNKVIFLLSCLLIVVVLSTLSFLQYFNVFIKYYSKECLLCPLVYTATFGSIGGFLSVSMKLQKMELESGVPKYMFFVYGIERSVISIFAAIILFCLIKSKLLLGYIIELDKPIFALMTFSVVAGFSETLIPDLLGKMEKSVDKNRNLTPQ
jgi:hypothetical protein